MKKQLLILFFLFQPLNCDSISYDLNDSMFALMKVRKMYRKTGFFDFINRYRLFSLEEKLHENLTLNISKDFLLYDFVKATAYIIPIFIWQLLFIFLFFLAVYFTFSVGFFTFPVLITLFCVFFAYRPMVSYWFTSPEIIMVEKSRIYVDSDGENYIGNKAYLGAIGFVLDEKDGFYKVDIDSGMGTLRRKGWIPIAKTEKI